MGKMQRTKGYLGEREVVQLLEELGVHAKRVPLSGATSFQKDDVLLEDGSTIEVKRRKKISKFFYDVLKTADYGFIREDTNRSVPVVDKWLVVMDLKKFAGLFRRSQLWLNTKVEVKGGYQPDEPIKSLNPPQGRSGVPIYPTYREIQYFANELRGLVMLKTTREMLKEENIKECIVTYITSDGKEHKEKFKVQENGFVPILKECHVTNVEEVKNDD